MLPIQKKISEYNHYKGNNIYYLVIHDVGTKSTAKNNVDYFSGGNRGASAHYFVDDESIWQSVEDGNGAWHVGDGNGEYGISNTNSIGIEMCLPGGTVTAKTEQNTIELAKYIMNKYNIPISRVVRHYDASRKNCPAQFNLDGNWARWNQFKQKLADQNVTIQTVPDKPDQIVGNLDSVNINNMALAIKSWLADNTKSVSGDAWIFFMNEAGTKELARFKATKIKRADVKKVHPKINEDCGIELNMNTPNGLKGQKVRLLLRIASDSKGDKSIIEKTFPNVFQIPDKINTGQLDFKIPVVDEFYLAGWHLSDEVYKSAYSYVIFIDVSTKKEIARIDITKSSFLSSADVRKHYPLYLADNCRFEVKAKIPDSVKGKKVEVLQRYAKNANGEGTIADLRYKDTVQF